MTKMAKMVVKCDCFYDLAENCTHGLGFQFIAIFKSVTERALNTVALDHPVYNQRSLAIEKDEKFLFPLLNILTPCCEVFSVDWLCQYFLFQVSCTINGTTRLSKKREKIMCHALRRIIIIYKSN